jgi:Hint domain
MAWDPIYCFTFGTLIDTPDGACLIEELGQGDLVTTLGNGSQPLRWTGSRRVTAAEMQQTPDLQPVEFAAGVVGNARPLLVSPQHRLLLNDWRAQVYFGEDEVLIPAKAMVNGTTIRQVLPAEGVTYVHLLFDRHEILVSDGALSESFHPGEAGLQSLDAAQRRELDLLFPGMELQRRRAAFPIVKLSEARALRLPD